MVFDHLRGQVARQFESAVAVRRPHHGDLHALVAQAGHPSRPFAFDRAPAFELEAELTEELDRRGEVLDDDAHVVDPDGHPAGLVT